MSKKALDLDYMQKTVAVKTRIRVGVTNIYGFEPPFEPPPRYL